MLMKNVNGINMPLDEADLAQRMADAQLMPAPLMPTITALVVAGALLAFTALERALLATAMAVSA